MVGDCGHAMYFERPAEFAHITTEFLVRDTQLSGQRR
jgi:hypothetical protein